MGRAASWTAYMMLVLAGAACWSAALVDASDRSLRGDWRDLARICDGLAAPSRGGR